MLGGTVEAEKGTAMECQCRLRTRLVGDGCEVCNSQLAIDLIAEERIELLNLKYAIGGWTEEEAARFEELNTAMNRLSPRVTPEMLAALEKLTPNVPNSPERRSAASTGPVE